MYRIMLQKLWHKKWMNLCLLLGCILLIATVVSFPLYQSAAYDRMLQDEFTAYLETEGNWPATNKLLILSKKDPAGESISRMEKFMENIHAELGVTEKQVVSFYSLSKMELYSTMNRWETANLEMRLGGISDLPNHVKMIGGEMYSESGISEDGCIEVVISQDAMIECNLLLGETLIFRDLRDINGKEIKLTIKGVFEPVVDDSYFWQVEKDKLNNNCLMNMDLFRSMFTGANAKKYTITCNYYPMFEYEDLTAGQVKNLMEKTDYMTQEGPYRSTLSEPPYRAILDSYNRKLERIQATLMILQIPVLIMLGAFLFMISGQMYDMERNEISVIKSRGSSGAQIFRLYLYQSLFLTIVGGCFGIPLGSLFSRILGSAESFLEFNNQRVLNIVFTEEAAAYALAAMLATLLIMTLPALKHSRVTIVKLKQQKALKTKSWWEKLFLDVILIGISLYGFYSFRKNSGSLAENVIKGEALDPLLYISSSLFIIGMGLLFLRIQPRIVQLIYMVGKRFWGPASYASFMENIKNGRKQQFIMLFLIMTISLGMYHATVARTILSNACSNTEYLDGADVVLMESWTAVLDRNGSKTGEYMEPDYGKYATLEFAEKSTRVLVDNNATIKGANKSRQAISVMGIHTREFGEITWVEQSLNGEHYYELLNKLAADSKGIIVSDNFRSKLGMKEGDTLSYRNGDGKDDSAKILGFFNYFPGYSPTETVLNPDGTVTSEDRYLVVGHYAHYRQSWGVTPYEIWIQMKEGHSSDEVLTWASENELSLKKYVSRETDVRNTITDPLLQGTNGVLTMGFIVTIILCAVGYLIYWIMSIRSREMIFGVLRACGMHKGELFQMLMNEQIFSGVFSVLAGIGIGKLTSQMFVPILQQAYAANNQVLPMQLVVDSADMVRLYGVIAGVMVVCFVVLILLLFKMNVAKALKLGEE